LSHTQSVPARHVVDLSGTLLSLAMHMPSPANALALIANALDALNAAKRNFSRFVMASSRWQIAI
jgi:hypothetical protein